ncbi:hypothetical protein ACIQWZ_33185 [Streptomyces sp. NPDC098077]|uniref:hypothetical protein n=1 Tax=Streptomyces sp. NPDC098077 TaxID=3366093 RepID=UPI0038217172
MIADRERTVGALLGSVVALADETGTKVSTYAYSPSGVQRATTTEQVPRPYRFTGGYQDPTGLLSLGGFVDNAGTAFDIGGVVSNFASGDTKAGFAGLAGMAGGALVGPPAGAQQPPSAPPPVAWALRSESAATQRRNSGVMPPKTLSTGNL